MTADRRLLGWQDHSARMKPFMNDLRPKSVDFLRRLSHPGSALDTVPETPYGVAGPIMACNAHPFAQRSRDVRTVTQQIQGHAAHFETMGQILLGRMPARATFTF